MAGTVPWLPLLLGYAALVFWGYCLFDFARTDERDIRAFTKPAWVALLVLGSVLGGLLWLVLGRPQRPRPRR
jgi:hypothetical protein